jgi:glycosyltransferase involved in cell wall biosynthesis
MCTLGEVEEALNVIRNEGVKDVILLHCVSNYPARIEDVNLRAMEAVALNKPVIILNLSGEPDVVDYVEQGVALGVYKEGELKPTIEKLLKDDSELAKNRKKYIEKYLYKIDGKATERVVKLIEEMIKNGRKNNGA